MDRITIPLPASCYSDSKGNTFQLKPKGAVIHDISNRYQNPDNPFILDEIIANLVELGLSYHYIIGRDGKVYQLVGKGLKVWHAGASRMNSRDWCNNFCYGIAFMSIGKSINGEPAYTDAQLKAYAELMVDYLDYGKTVLPEWVQGHRTVRSNFKRKYPNRKIRGKIPRDKYDPSINFPYTRAAELIEIRLAA